MFTLVSPVVGFGFVLGKAPVLGLKIDKCSKPVRPGVLPSEGESLMSRRLPELI